MIKYIKYVAITNIISFLVVSILLICYGSKVSYFKFGPNDQLIFINIPVDTAGKYIMLLFLITVINISDMLYKNIARPIFHFTIFNIIKQDIDLFSENELLFYSNGMTLLNSFRDIFQTIVKITQIDIALYACIIDFICHFFISRMWLKNKKFINKSPLLVLSH